MRVLIENSKLIYRNDSVFMPMLETLQFGNNKYIFQKYPWVNGGENDGEIFLKKGELIFEEKEKQIAKAIIGIDEVAIKLLGVSYSFYKGKEKAFLFKSGKQVASIWLNLPHMEVIDITFEFELPHQELALIILSILRFKVGLISKKTIFEKLNESSQIDESRDWRPTELTEEKRDIEFNKEIERFVAIKHPTELIFDDRMLVFPWLQDTMQYWGDRPIAWKEKCMSHLLYLLSLVQSEYDHCSCEGYRYALGSYNAGLYIYSPDGDWNYEPIGLALQQTNDENAITDLIDILEDSCDMELYEKYIAPLANHESPYVKASVFDSKKRMS